MRNYIIILAVCLLVASCTGLKSDPETITGLFAYTAPGDDGMSGQADRVQIRMALTSDSLVNNWSDCQIISEHVPAAAGVRDTVQASFDIETGIMYYFALKAADEVQPYYSTYHWRIESGDTIALTAEGRNWSILSNVTTRIYPDITAPSVVMDFDFGN